jgi:hypothetical protein
MHIFGSMLSMYLFFEKASSVSLADYLCWDFTLFLICRLRFVFFLSVPILPFKIYLMVQGVPLKQEKVGVRLVLHYGCFLRSIEIVRQRNLIAGTV